MGGFYVKTIIRANAQREQLVVDIDRSQLIGDFNLLLLLNANGGNVVHR
jgi:hypothetical protein